MEPLSACQLKRFRGRQSSGRLYSPRPILYCPRSPAPLCRARARNDRQSNSDTLVTVYGGSGFLGRHVVRALAKRDYRIRVAVRRPDLAGHLQPLGKVGQIHAVQANLRNAARSRRRRATPMC